MIARTEVNSVLDLGYFNEGYLLLVGPDSVKVFGWATASGDDAVID